MSLNGIDISSWQGGINLHNIACDFVIVKSSGGKSYSNPYFKEMANATLASGKLLGIYHYAHDIGYQGTAKEEAEHFIRTAGEYIGKAIFVLDWESDNKHDVAWAKEFLEIVSRETGGKCVFYTYTSVLNSYNFSSISDYPLWLANYSWNDERWGFKPRDLPANPYFRNVPLFQYNSNTRLNGWGGVLDANIFYGSREDWQKMANGKVVEKEQEYEEIKGDDGMIEMAVVYKNAIWYLKDDKMKVLKNPHEWNVLQALYTQNAIHKGYKQKNIYVANWDSIPFTFDVWCNFCGYDVKTYKDKFENEVTEGLKEIKKELGFTNEKSDNK